MAWTNEDGLVVRYGTERAAVMPGGVTNQGVTRFLTHKFTYADVGPTDTAAANPHAGVIPAGSVITRATLYVTTGWVGSGATLDIGLKIAAGTNTLDDGIDEDIAVTALNEVGDVISCNGALVLDPTGDLTGVDFTADQYIMTTYNTAAFTAGAATLVVEYMNLGEL
jgi:hypothetical protein